MEEPHFRRSARSSFDVEVGYRLDVDGAALQRGGRVQDIGMGGVFVTCASAPPVGTHVRLVFALPTAWEPLDVPARVRWVRPDGFGAEFGALTPRQAEALFELVQRLGFEEPA